jgi:hypothetical protein
MLSIAAETAAKSFRQNGNDNTGPLPVPFAFSRPRRRRFLREPGQEHVSVGRLNVFEPKIWLSEVKFSLWPTDPNVS